MAFTFSRRFFLSGSAAASALTLNAPFGSVEAQSRKIYAKRFKGKKAPRIRIGKWVQKETKLSGKPILLKFFATWCPVCRTSIKPLNKLQKELGSRVTVVAISDQNFVQVQRFIKGSGAKFSAGIDSNKKTFKAYGIKGTFPHFVMINSRGRVVDEGPMPVHDYARLKRRIKRWV